MKQNTSYMKDFIPYALAAFMVGFVGGFTAVLSPAFVKDIGIAYNNTTWTALALAMSTAACAPVLGKLSDVIGRRRTLLFGIAIFTLGNILTALSATLSFMLISRFIVGIGTAAVATVILSHIVTTFPVDAAAKGFSIYMLISSAAVIFGPTLGGVMTETVGWRIMMWVCTAISAIVFIICFFLTQKDSMTGASFSGFDSTGAVFILIFFSLLLGIPSFGQNFGWTSVPFLVILALAAAALPCLILIEKRATNPILQKEFLARKTFILPVLILFLTQGLMQANMTNIIVFVNYTQPENTLISSYAISIMYLGMSLGSVIAGPMADSHEPKNVLSVTLTLTGIGCALMLLFDESTSALLLAGALGILGFGLGGNGTIFMKVVLSGLSPRMAGLGTGTYGLFRDLSAPFGVAVFVPMFTNSITNLMSTRSVTASVAAVSSIHSLALAELACVIAGIAVVRMLPAIHGQTK